MSPLASWGSFYCVLVLLGQVGWRAVRLGLATSWSCRQPPRHQPVPPPCRRAAHWQFADRSHFIRAFKKQYGRTPSEYARPTGPAGR
ncbi:AraC family transcriptional regulator [Streptomyces sp. Root369]|uniref:AraC family transcriptional regulator n=1 Tax=Streptomyces sp. Root369 TaxID=1736523 RepID=UPI001F5B334E|nr:AraC family transcriptional regulator [Streptomyces sp. Root369]